MSTVYICMQVEDGQEGSEGHTARKVRNVGGKGERRMTEDEEKVQEGFVT